MGKITIDLNDELEQKLRLYIAKHYPMKIHGKIIAIIKEALTD